MDAYWNDGFPGEVIYGDPIPEDERGRDNSFIVPKEIADAEEVPYSWDLIKINALAVKPDGSRARVGVKGDAWIGQVIINGLTYEPDQTLFSSLQDAQENARRTATAIAAMIDRQMWRLGWAPAEED